MLKAFPGVNSSPAVITERNISRNW